MTEEGKIRLEIDSPFPAHVGGFGLILPVSLSEESISIVRAQLEFRRKCMNQGFDNLLELLELSRKALLVKDAPKKQCESD